MAKRSERPKCSTCQDTGKMRVGSGYPAFVPCPDCKPKPKK